MSNLSFYSEDGAWKRRGHPDVLPGHLPTDPAPPTILRKIQIARTVATSPGPTPPPPPPPPAGTFRFGVDQLSTLETEAGVRVGAHRTYFGWDTWSNLVSQAASDKAAGRLPVTSIKLPATGNTGWQNCADGDYDAEINSRIQQLVNLDTRVIVSFHHEPEGDGTLSVWRAMYAHLVPLVNKGKVELWSGFTGYHQLFGSSEWKLDAVLVPGVKGQGYDPYQSYLASSNSWTNHDTSYYNPYRDHAAAHGYKWGIWETGINEQAAASGRAETLTWMRDRALGAKNRGADHWIYFNSETTFDGLHNWKLTTTGPANKRAQFITEMQRYAL